MGLLDSILGKGQPSRPAVKEKPPTLEDIAAEEEQAGKEALAQAQARLKQAKGGR